MPEDERSPDAPPAENGSGARTVSQELRDKVDVFSKAHQLSQMETERLLASVGQECFDMASLEGGGNTYDPEEVFERALSANGPIVFRAARATLPEHVRVKDPRDYDLMLLTAVQPHLRSVLPDEICVNLGFHGTKSSGKTKATKIVVRLSGAGDNFYVGGSPAALRDTFGTGQLVGLDEVDTQTIRDKNLEGILRAGNSWDATYLVGVPVGKGWKSERRNIGGPKVFNYRTDIEDALKSRTYVIELPRQNDSELVVRNLFLGNPTGKIAERLRRLCARKVLAWSKESVERHMKDPEFIARLDRLPATIARQKETAAVFLVIADILGLDLDSEMAQATQGQVEQDTENEEVCEVLREMYTSRPSDAAKDWELPQSLVLERINEKRVFSGEKPWPPNGRIFKAALADLGFEPAKKRSAGGARYLTFTGEVRRRIGVEG